MIDFHNHVLPNVDDGARSLTMSLEMLKDASDQGITDVVNTVHYQHPKVETEDISLKRIHREIKRLQEELIKHDIPIKLHCGAEVFFLPNLLKVKEDPLATFGHGNYMLVEFQPHQLPDIYKKELFNLKMSGVTPIIAHPERYKPVQKNFGIIENWLDAGCIIQVDAGSILGYLGPSAKLASEKIIKNGWCQILGSDAHDNLKRKFCLSEAVDLVRNLIGDSVNSMVKDNPKAVIEGKPIIFEFEYEKKEKISLFSRIKDKLDIT